MDINQQQQVQHQPQHQNKQHPLSNYQFSADELRVLKECNTESFFQRSLPLGTGFGLAAYFSVRSGYFKPSVRWGAGPKVMVGVIIGYFVGKFSYQGKCSQKIMQLPNSRLAEMLKAKKKGSLYEQFTPDQGFGAGLAMGPFSSQSSDNYSDEFFKKNKQTSALDLDIDRPSQNDLDDSKRGNVDAEKYEDDLPNKPAREIPVTYEELRRKNRDEYQNRVSGAPTPYSPPREEQPIVIRERTQQSSDGGGPSPKGAKNKYGDVWTQ